MKIYVSNPPSGLAMYMDQAARDRIVKLGPRIRYEKTDGNTIILSLVADNGDAIRGTGVTSIQKNAPKGKAECPYKVVFPHRGPNTKFGMVEVYAPVLSFDKKHLEVKLPAQLPAAVTRKSKYDRDKPERTEPRQPQPQPQPQPRQVAAKRSPSYSTEVKLEIAGQTFTFDLPEGEVLNYLLDWTEKGFRRS